MPNYGEIYDDIIGRQDNYNKAEHSPGYQACVLASDALAALSGPSLDVGCGVGFVVEYLAHPFFRFSVHGVDASAVAVERSRERLARSVNLPPDRIQRITNQTLPFDPQTFALVTCFDMLEHLDEPDIQTMTIEMWRVLRPGGLWLATVSCRPAGSVDLHGDNLHRTIRGVDWWLARTQPDRAVYHAGHAQLTLWKRM